MRWFAPWFLALGVWLPAALAQADPHPMSAGGAPGPAVSSDVALVRENLHISLTRTHALVDAELQLRAATAVRGLKVGFPCERGAERGTAALDCKTKIKVTVDGKKVQTRRTKSDWVWQMNIPADRETTIRVTYRVKLRNERYDQPYFGLETLHYRLRTGASWAGPIGELNIEVELPTDAVVHIAPAGFEREPGRITWKLRDYEPSDDIAILVHPRYLGLSSRAIPAKTPEEYRHALDSGSFDPKAMAELADQLTKDEGDMVRFALTVRDSAHNALGLAMPAPGQVESCVRKSASLIRTAAKRAQPIK